VGFKDLVEARKEFDKEAFKNATELIASIERAADAAHAERLKDSTLSAEQTRRVGDTLTMLRQAFEEAASYGMDVEDGLLFVRRAKSALDSRDVVSAAKLTRRAKARSGSIETDLDTKRIDAGVLTKVDEAKCGKCGKETLYVFPDQRSKCIECGHTFSMGPPPKTVMAPLESPVSSSEPVSGRQQGDGSASSKGRLFGMRGKSREKEKKS
jgi:hypothetical protein